MTDRDKSKLVAWSVAATTMKQLILLLCIIGASGFYNEQFLKMEIEEEELHKIRRRQTNEDEFAKCGMLVHDELCKNGLFQELVNFLVRCDLVSSAHSIQEICTPNSMGGYCNDYIPYTQEHSITRECNSSNSVCSQECRNALIISRYELGCCIQRVYNSSTSSYADLFSYSLWSACRVSPITQECPPSTVTLPSTSSELACNTTEFSQLTYSAVCKRRYIESIVTRVSHIERCQNYHSAYSGLGCKANRYGIYCDGLENHQLVYHYTTASARCNESDMLCDQLCRATLQNITNSVGCCFIDMYARGTHGMQEWLSSDFWSVCGIEYPGNCQPRYTDDDFQEGVRLIIALVICALAIIIIIAALIIITVCAVKVKKQRAGKGTIDEHVQNEKDHVYDSIQEREGITMGENVAYATTKAKKDKRR